MKINDNKIAQYTSSIPTSSENHRTFITELATKRKALCQHAQLFHDTIFGDQLISDKEATDRSDQQIYHLYSQLSST